MNWDHAHVSQHQISVTGHGKHKDPKSPFLTIKLTYNLKAGMEITIRKVEFIFESLIKRKIVGGLRLNELIQPPKYGHSDLIIDFFTEDVESTTEISLKIPYLLAIFSKTINDVPISTISRVLRQEIHLREELVLEEGQAVTLNRKRKGMDPEVEKH
ncbi:hypothetical protein RF11_10468 [Thelohanellus kitauei]|uniref:Uncharacterized protein n=1 Tax=Thelohanellus kitauei TaxID=669202 RepID=A0A0C2MV87_THEKT|nr:hypothetical protein RF11_10468 [Thelohanellus kitauei]